MSDPSDISFRDLVELGNELSRETRDEVRRLTATAAKEAECASRAERLRADQADGLKRVWVAIEGLKGRVQRLEDRKRRDSGARAERRRWVGWLLKFGVPAGTAAAGALGTWLFRGCL